MDQDNIFVYGTLRRTFDGEMAHWLSCNASFLSMGYFQGLLFEIDRYPGAVPCSENHRQVLGELYKIHDLAFVLSALDDYEECSGRFPEPHEYRRLQSKIRLPKGGSVSAWVYVYNRPIDRLEPILSGDYEPYFLGKIKV